MRWLGFWIGWMLVADLAAQPPASAPELVRVEGQVVDKGTRQGIPGARVVLVRLDRPGSRITGDIWDMADSPPGAAPDSMQMAATASRHGEFSFVITRPARCALFVSAPGYVRGGGLQHAFEAGAAEERHAVTIELERETSISGRLVDADTGKPLPGMAVTAWRYRTAGVGQMGGGRALVPEGKEAITEKDGGFRLAGLPPDRYFLKAGAPLGAKIGPALPVEDFLRQERRAYQDVWYPGAAERREAIPLTVSGDGLQGLEFRVSQRRVAAVRARVEVPGLEGTVLVAVIRVQQELAAAGFSIVAQGDVKPGEVFEVSGLAPGRYLLSAVTRAGGALRGLLYQDIGEENVEGLVIPLFGGVEVGGKVRIAGREPRPGEAVLSVEGLRILLDPEVRTGASPKPAEVSSGSGEFSMQGVIPDRYTLWLGGKAPGYKVAEVRYNGAVCPHGMFAIDPGAAEHRLEVTLDAASASIAVQVSDGLRPSPRAVVLLAREPVLLRLHPDVLWPVEADEGGNAVAADLLPGTYRVAAWRAGEPFFEDPQFADRIRDGAQVRVGAGGQARIQIRPHTVIGVVP